MGSKRSSKCTDDSEVKNRHQNMDASRGWIIVFASFFNAFLIDGTGSAFGLLFPHIMDKYDSPAYLVSLAGSLFVALLIMGVPSVLLVRKFGFRITTMTGGVLSCIALASSAYSSNLFVFIFTYGLLAGCSCGLVFLPSILIVNCYFHHNRGIANGIIMSGSGAGLMVLSPLIKYLLEAYSLEGTILILSGLLLNMCVFSSLYHEPCHIDQETVKEQDNKTETIPLVPESSSYPRVGVTVDMNKMGEVDKSQELCSNIEPHKHSHQHSVHGVHLDVPRISVGRNGPLFNDTLSGPKCQKSVQGLKLGNQFLLQREHNACSACFKSEDHLNNKPVQPSDFHASHPLHQSVHSIPTWLKDHNKHLALNNGFDHHHYCFHRKRCSKSKHYNRHHFLSQKDFVSVEHGSNYYLTGSLSTLWNLQSKRVQSRSGIQLSVLKLNGCDPHIDKAGGKLENAQNKSDCEDNVLNMHQKEKYLHPKETAKTQQSSFLQSETDILTTEDEDFNIVLGHTKHELFRMPSFHMFSFGTCIIQFGYPIAGVYLADFAYQRGLNTSDSAVLMLLLGGLNICGRLTSGILANLLLDPLHLNNCALLIGALACFLSPIYTTFWSLCILASSFGFFLGFFPPLQPLIIVKFFGISSLDSAFGFLTTAKGVANILGIPLAGWIYDKTGDFAWSFVFAGAAFIVSAIFHYLMLCCKQSYHNRENSIGD